MLLKSQLVKGFAFNVNLLLLRVVTHGPKLHS